MRFLFLFFASLHASQCIFTPPPGWEIAQLKTPSPYVKIGFIGRGTSEFRPSMNLSTEEVDVSLKEYVKAVKELHLADPAATWRDLGKLSMKAGTGRLVEMSGASPYGETKILQAFFVKSEMAYILTAAILKEDFPKIQAELLKSFQSLNVLDDLWAPAPDLFASLGRGKQEEEWQKVQDTVKSLPELGPYWQFLVLQEGRSKIYPNGDNL